jgi:hypothetical protein
VSGKGKAQSEPRSAAAMVERGAVYVCDRGFGSFPLLEAVIDGAADLVVRVKHDLNFAPREDTPLDEQDRAAGVIGDRVGRLTGSPNCKAPRHDVREILVADPGPGRTRRRSAWSRRSSTCRPASSRPCTAGGGRSSCSSGG